MSIKQSENKWRLAADDSRSGADAAVDGLIAGLAAGMIMGMYLGFAGWLSGSSFAEVMRNFSIQQTVSPAIGALSHLATSAIYGTIFGLLSRPLLNRIPLWLLGIGYSAALYSAAVLIFLPEMNSPLSTLPSFHFGFAHAIYGVVLGLLVARIRNTEPSTNAAL